MYRFHSTCAVLLASFAQAMMPALTPHSQAAHLCCKVEDCNHRMVQPNLRLIRPTHLFGILTDQSGAKFERSQVELRRWISPTNQVSVKSVETDHSGRFDLGEIEAGQYRFLPSPHGTFKQPESVSCPEAECRVELVLKVNPTDTPESVCPIR
jgi:hypothetical protein